MQDDRGSADVRAATDLEDRPQIASRAPESTWLLPACLYNDPWTSLVCANQTDENCLNRYMVDARFGYALRLFRLDDPPVYSSS
jgi:hypothetical protein